VSTTQTHSQVHTQQCVWLDCADCGTDSYDEGTPHFASEAEGRRQILGEDGYGWTERADGRLMCRHCSDRADCAEHGHDMGEWTRHAGDAEIEWRYCQHCGGEIEDRLVAMGWPS
jgi:hypothetical protein